MSDLFVVVAISHSQAKWRSAQEDEHSETAVFIEPPEGAVTRVSLGVVCRHSDGPAPPPNPARPPPSVSARRPGVDADAASGLLLPPAHAAAAVPLPADGARAAAAVHGRIHVRPNTAEETDAPIRLRGLKLHVNFAL